MRTPTISRAFGAILRRRRAKGAPPTRRALFEPLEARELLDVAGGALQITDLSSRQTLADSAIVYLSSFYADATGAPTLPDYGETVYRRLARARHMRDRVAHFDLGRGLDARDDVTHIAGA